MKIGRNDPCPCGSGRKYKQCCLVKEAAPQPGEIEWRRVRRAIDGLPAALLRTAERHFGAAALDEAWDEFNLWELDEPFDPDSPYVQVFMPWFYYDWLPDAEETEVRAAAHEITAAQAYLQSAGARLDPLRRRYVEAAGEAPFSFYEILECSPGRGFRLRDLLLETEVDVLERQGSVDARPGDLVYAKVVPIEGIAVLEGCTPVLIPPSFKDDILEFRAKTDQDATSSRGDLLRDYDYELRSMFLGMAEAALDPAPPNLVNTDGDPLEFRTLLYDIDSPREAFDALKDLARVESEEELMEGAEVDDAGRLVKAEIVWSKAGNAVHESWENTVLGRIRIAPGRLEADVNSAARDARLRALIEERLGDKARFRVAKVESVRSALERERTPEEEAAAREAMAESARLAELPEVRAQFAEMMRKHYATWVDQKIPALGHRTPREAVKDPDGRAAVERLIREIERNGSKMSPPLDEAITDGLRKDLGLEPG